MTLEACTELVRTQDPDRFGATLVARPEDRPALITLYALNLEIARAPFQSAEPMLAEMRLQWWRDQIDACARYAAAAGVPYLSAGVTTVCDPQVSAVFCARGGYGVQRIVTDESWTATDSAITFATLYDGQHEDRRLAPGAPRPVRLLAALGPKMIELSGSAVCSDPCPRDAFCWGRCGPARGFLPGQSAAGPVALRARRSACTARRCCSLRCAPLAGEGCGTAMTGTSTASSSRVR